jgi:pyrimidine operon attenuation protein/uracil phosphoribosyltransferase
LSPRDRGATGSAGERELLSAADLARTVARMAHQVIEKNALDMPSGDLPPGGKDPGIILLGIPTRGTPLAERLSAKVAEFSGVELPTGALDVTLYRDDLRRRPNRPLEPTSLPAGGVDDRLVILVDDVLFSGRTIRAALDALRDEGRPRAVQLAVLVDRGHRELPIRADYVGKNLPTARTEDVAVLLTEMDGADAVLLRGGKEGAAG